MVNLSCRHPSSKTLLAATSHCRSLQNGLAVSFGGGPGESLDLVPPPPHEASFRTVTALPATAVQLQQQHQQPRPQQPRRPAPPLHAKVEPLYATLLGRSHSGGGGGRSGSVGRARGSSFGASASREELTDAEGKRLISLQAVADPKYDSDSDFDYRQRPPRYVRKDLLKRNKYVLFLSPTVK